ncbi:hypothetical protein [Shimia sp. SDUM112013]|uniref:hypothetical protein n=1 Tax=Shimia sp. SDUM112013 TaxID=3136160 RepID=UPI0032EF3A61
MKWFKPLLAVLICAPGFALAQIQDSVFKDYKTFERFVDREAKSRDIATLLSILGGRDELTSEQIRNIEGQFLALYPEDFENVVVFNRKDLGNGITQEARAYWIGLRYVYFYFMLHQRDDELVVLRFSFNSLPDKMLKEF